MARLRLLTLIAVVFAAIIFMAKNQQSTTTAGEGLLVDKDWLTTNAHPITPAKDIRPADQTFLTYPEWFLVFSPAEQADYFTSHTSTSFPYMTHVSQLWEGYRVVYDQVKDNYKFNTGYHVMIMVIGVSTTVEYFIKSVYETVIGRITDKSTGSVITAEDRFNANYMRRYVNFIEDTPWYEYSFSTDLKRLWKLPLFSGSSLFRKLERRYYLTTELLVKGGYGWLIKQATKSAYDAALLNTAVVVDHFPRDAARNNGFGKVRLLPDSLVLIDLPRYADFSVFAGKLAELGADFKEVAGNRSAIMLTVLSSEPMKSGADYNVLFNQPIVTQPGVQRVAIAVKVSSLATVLRELHRRRIRVEHIYDY
ncbi:hypothetical protein [Hufsiella ginkgonis]|uniref:Uncharacterized protein n=1 Tax=Hufsiella ginkgonis TaxID=2695274 RepID=A0A7K1XZY7_9SPHI|nr:hypothetical protein [Hufsiella ginkgonis]MXV16530.1 hypothetical protein [Hufsiella ginkgonis]